PGRTARAPQQCLQHAGMRAFLRGHPRRGRLGLLQVIVPTGIFARGDRRENQLRPEAPREPGEEARPPAGPAWPWLTARGAELLFPEPGVLVLHRRQRAVHARDRAVRFAIRHGTVVRGPVDVVLPVLPISPDSIRVWHGSAFPCWPPGNACDGAWLRTPPLNV